MYTKVTPKAGQNGPMWLYVGSVPTILPLWLGKNYNYFSRMCRGWPNGHPGMRAGEAPLTRLACHAGYKGGGDSVERGDASSLDGWRPSPDLERCCKSAQYSFPCDYPAGTSLYPLLSTGRPFVRGRRLQCWGGGTSAPGRLRPKGTKPLNAPPCGLSIGVLATSIA